MNHESMILIEKCFIVVIVSTVVAQLCVTLLSVIDLSTADDQTI